MTRVETGDVLMDSREELFTEVDKKYLQELQKIHDGTKGKSQQIMAEIIDKAKKRIYETRNAKSWGQKTEDENE